MYKEEKPLDASRGIPNIAAQRMNYLVALIFLGFLSLTGMAAADSRANLRELMAPPTDSLEAKRVRIWVPVEQQQACRVTITIVDSSGGHVREIISKVLSMAYYNFYWDKKDDSGRFVAPGVYQAIIEDVCAKKRVNSVEAFYEPGENSGDLFPSGERAADSVVFAVFADSAIVSVEVTNRVGRSEGFPIKDSLFTAGLHTFRWYPEWSRGGGLFDALITIDGYTRICPFRYKK